MVKLVVFLSLTPCASSVPACFHNVPSSDKGFTIIEPDCDVSIESSGEFAHHCVSLPPSLFWASVHSSPLHETRTWFIVLSHQLFYVPQLNDHSFSHSECKGAVSHSELQGSTSVDFLPGLQVATEVVTPI